MRKLKNISYSLIFLGFFAMLVHSIIPHHHHKHEVCFGTSHCCSHDECDDKTHEHGNDKCPLNADCNAKSPFTNRISSSDADTDIVFSDLVFECSQVLTILFNCESYTAQIVYSVFRESEYLFYINNSSGLRAPPCLV